MFSSLSKHPAARPSAQRGVVLRGWLLGTALLGLLAAGWVKCGGDQPVSPAAVVKAGEVPEGPGKELRKKIEKLTGARTRVVWARDLGTGKDTFANGRELVLMRLDTQEAGVERALVPEKGNVSRPLISPDGQTVIYSRRTPVGDVKVPDWESVIVALDWAGTNRRELRKGYAVDVWEDPKTGQAWVYALTTMRPGIGSNPEGYRLFRFPMTNPDKEEVVWDQGMISGDNIQLNRAGTAASGLIPWPNAGTFDFTSGRFIRYRNGCWPSLAPDDSGVVWVFDGTHENLRLFLPGVDGNWRVAMKPVDALKGKAAYHPRWSNDPRIVSFTGPHPVKVDQGSGKVSVILARFNESLTALEESVSLKNASGEPDCFPDVWVEGGRKASLDLAKIGSKKVRELASLPKVVAQAWEAPAEDLCFVWEKSTANNQIPATKRECSVTPVRHARYGPRFDLLTQGGAFVVDEASAQAIRDAVARGKWSLELAVTPLAPGTVAPGVIFRAGPGLELQQTQEDLLLRADGKMWRVGAALTGVKTTHLVIGNAPEPGMPPVVWIHGQAQDVRPLEGGYPKTPAESPGDEVQFGSRADGSAPWAGRVEKVAFHARPVLPEQAAGHAAWWKNELARAEPIPRTVVRAKLLESSTRATPDSIGAYRRSWTSALYEKTALVSGPDPGEKFGVAHWTLLDRLPVPGPPGNPGGELELTLEPMAARPEMDSEHGSEEVLGENDVLFLDVSPPGP